MNTDMPKPQDMDLLRVAMNAAGTVGSWATGAEVIEVVRAVHRAGWLTTLRTGVTADGLAAAKSVTAEHAANVLAVLEAAGVVRTDGDLVRLSEAFEALLTDVNGRDLPVVLDAVDVGIAQARQAARPTEARPELNSDQALVLARRWGAEPTAALQQLAGQVWRTVPEYRERLERGGPLLDVGVGIGGELLTALLQFGDLRAVGIEIVPAVAAEAQRRALRIGVADRVDIRAMDARALPDRSAFPVAYWAQPFFPTEARAATLAAIFRALQPDGVLLMQELFPPPAAPSLRQLLDRLFYQQQNMSWGRSAEALADEATAAGFDRARIVDSALGRQIVVRKPRSDGNEPATGPRNRRSES